MKVFTSFMAVGIICAIASIVYDMTKMTPGHITSLLVVVGAILGFFGTYDMLMEKFGYGLSLPITSFGNSLYKASIEGFKEAGFLGILKNMLTTTSAGISATIISSFVVALIARPHD